MKNFVVAQIGCNVTLPAKKFLWLSKKFEGMKNFVVAQIGCNVTLPAKKFLWLSKKI